MDNVRSDTQGGGADEDGDREDTSIWELEPELLRECETDHDTDDEREEADRPSLVHAFARTVNTTELDRAPLVRRLRRRLSLEPSCR